MPGMGQTYLSEMSLGIPMRSGFSPCPREVWQGLCDADPTSTFYHTPDWLEVTSTYLRQYGLGGSRAQKAQEWATTEVAPWHFRSDSFSAVLPLLRRRRWGAWHYFSPFGTYTSLVCAQALDASQRLEIEGRLAQANLLLTSSPFTWNAVRVGKALHHSIQAVDLAQVDPAHPMRDWEEGQQRRVRVARRSGVTLRQAQSESDWQAYDDLYRGSLERWGDATTLAYHKGLFDLLRNRLANSPRMILWLAEIPAEAAKAAGKPMVHSERVVAAGYLTFYHQGHVVPWHGAGDKDFFRYGVTQALFYHLIEDAARRGFRYFDLTGSSGLSGVASFKSRFGTRALSFEGSLNQVGLYGALARAKQWWRGAQPHQANSQDAVPSEKKSGEEA
jgi:Acetyltransferase (GNAT) domain